MVLVTLARSDAVLRLRSFLFDPSSFYDCDEIFIAKNAPKEKKKLFGNTPSSSVLFLLVLVSPFFLIFLGVKAGLSLGPRRKKICMLLLLRCFLSVRYMVEMEKTKMFLLKMLLIASLKFQECYTQGKYVLYFIHKNG